LQTKPLPASGGALASRIWNHSPDMARMLKEQQVGREPISAQELADIVAYLLMLNSQDGPGDAGLGKAIFTAKKCVSCHDNSGPGLAGGPPVTKLGEKGNAAKMAAAMWNHGEKMLEHMTQVGMSWPIFMHDEMNDLLAYLSIVAEGGTVDESARPQSAN
jgi:hypothetical protein